MSTRFLLRRPVALVASVALLTGGLTTGMLASPASAFPGTPSLTDFTPDTWDNKSTVQMTLTGTGFSNGDLTGKTNDYVFLTPDSATLVDATHEVAEFGFQVQPSSPPSTTRETVRMNLAKVPPGKYRVSVQDQSQPPNRSNYGHAAGDPTNPFFVVYAFEGANVSGSTFGTDSSACTVSTCGSRGVRPLDITGSNFAVGAQVDFLKPDGTPDAGMTFTQGNPNHSSNDMGNYSPTGTATADGVNGSGYVSPSLLQGNYAVGDDVNGAPPFAIGWHNLRVYNTDKRKDGSTYAVSQPWFAANGAIAPTGIGVGASNVVLTVTGKGIRDGSTLSVESRATNPLGGVPPPCAGATTSGPSTLSDPSSDGTRTISVHVSMADCGSNTDYTARAVTVTGPDGLSYTRPGLLKIVTNPSFTPAADGSVLTAGFTTLGQGARVGYGSQEVDIQGSGFEGDPAFPHVAGGDPNKMTKFTFGPTPGVTATTVLVGSGYAKIRIDVDNKTKPGPLSVTATNPDGGSATRSGDFLPDGTAQPGGKPAPLTIVAGPSVTKVNPAGLPPTGSVPSVVATGTFNSSDNYTVQVCDPDPAHPVDCTPTPHVTEAGATPTATTLTFAVSTNGATPGTKDLLVTDTSNNGRFYCSGCIGVDSLQLDAPTSVPNGPGPVTLTFSHATGMDQVTSSSTATLTRLVTAPGQDPIPLKSGTALTPGAAGSNSASGTFDVTSADPGQYSIMVVKDPGATSPTTWFCTGCLTITGQNITVTNIYREPGDKSATVGQGAKDIPITIKGANFPHGTQVSIADVSVRAVTVLSPSELSLRVDVDDAVKAESKTVTVTAGDGTGPDTGSTATTALTVTPKPSGLSAPSPASLGQGAGSPGYLAANPGKTVQVTITGSNFASDATLDLGPDITITNPKVTAGSSNPLAPTPDTLSVTAALAEGAATGKRDVKVVNGDGGVGTEAGAFTVNPGPKASSVTNENGVPVLVPDGAPHRITVDGANFATADPKTALTVTPNAGITVTNVAVTASRITADVTVAADASRGARTLGLTNSSDQGFGSNTVYVAAAPSAPGALSLTPGGGSLTARWTAPASDGGAPVSSYHLGIVRSGTSVVTAADVNSSTLSYTFTGLVTGASYTVSVAAANVAGGGPARTANGVAGLGTTLTSIASARSVTAGSAVRFSGKLVSGTAPVSGASIRLTFARSVGGSFVRYVTTNIAGAWSNVYVPTVSFTMTAAYLGNADNRAAGAPRLSVPVLARVLITSPSASVVRSRAGTTLRISGTVYPNKRGKTVYLFRYVRGHRTLLARAVLSRTSTYSFPTRLGRGTYYVRVYIPATTGNAAGYSRVLTIRRV